MPMSRGVHGRVLGFYLPKERPGGKSCGMDWISCNFASGRESNFQKILFIYVFLCN